jgi:DNA repair exonuclease SbcCD ATPase subunit
MADAGLVSPAGCAVSHAPAVSLLAAGSLNNAFENGLKPSLPDIKLEEVLLLDEPTTGLDAPIRRRLRDLLRDLLTGLDIPVFYVTHD